MRDWLFSWVAIFLFWVGKSILRVAGKIANRCYTEYKTDKDTLIERKVIKG